MKCTKFIAMIETEKKIMEKKIACHSMRKSSLKRRENNDLFSPRLHFFICKNARGKNL